jgi:D-tagatose-1,6-bisphosphate aldolase subunit GatZ/KbaZ
MSCKGDPVPLGDREVAARAARLCAVAEQSWQEAGGEPPVYVVGTEVPVPGGATEGPAELQVTSAAAAAETLRVHREAFAASGIGSAWDRVVGLVVQPGVEFGHDHVVDYQPDKARSLSRIVEDYPQMVFEAHSTDYQIPSNLRLLVNDHFAILKVGPALTYALREAYWALDQIEQEWVGEVGAVQLRKTVLTAMQEEPKHWANYYTSGGARLALDMQFSLSDRIRYYWTMPAVADAAGRLEQSLLASPPPLTLLMQYLPAQYSAIRRGEISNNPKEIVMHKIDEVLLQYSNACAQGSREGS